MMHFRQFRTHSPSARRLAIETLEARQLLAITVDTLVDEADNSIDDGDISLRDAISAATPGETIDFSITGTINLTLGELTLDNDLMLIGPGSGQLVIDAGGNSRVIRVTSPAVASISGLTLAGGNADRGAGLRSYAGATTTLSDLVITGNTSTELAGDAGGGIWNSGDLTLADSLVSGNVATTGSGGGIANVDGTLNVTNSTLMGNSANAYGGGGVYNLRGMVTIANSTIAGNSADAGGGVFNLGSVVNPSTVTLVSSTLTNNSADSGGGLWNYGQASVTNSTLSGNSAISGGGIWSSGSTTVSFSTLSGNSATSGGGILNDFGRTTLNGTIVANSPSGGEISGKGPFVGSNNLIEGGGVGGIATVTGDPLLGPLQDNGGLTFTHELLPGSPAIDAGDSAALPGVGDVPLFDQRGANFDRVQNGRIDIGAFENQAALSPSADFDEDGDIDGSDFLSWQKGFGITAPNAAKSDGDADNDTDVDVADLNIWRGQYSLPVPVAGFVASNEAVLSGELVDAALALEWFDAQQGNSETLISDYAVSEIALQTSSNDLNGSTALAIAQAGFGIWEAQTDERGGPIDPRIAEELLEQEFN